MLNSKDEIRISQAIIHIMDPGLGMPVLSDAVLDLGSDLADFLKAHIYRIDTSDDVKNCSFLEDSQIFPLAEEWDSEKFVEISQKIAGQLYTIMSQNIDIPGADLLVVEYMVEKHRYLALLKMNYKTSYTHLTNSDPWGNNNDIIQQKAILGISDSLPDDRASLASVPYFGKAGIEKYGDIILKMVREYREEKGLSIFRASLSSDF